MQQILVCVSTFLRTHDLFFPAENSSCNTLPVCMAAVHLDPAVHLALPFTPPVLCPQQRRAVFPYRSHCLSTVKTLAKNTVTVALGPLSRRPVNLLCNF